MIGNSNENVNFPHKSFLPNTQVLKIGKAFENGSSAKIIKFLKTLVKNCTIGRIYIQLIGSIIKESGLNMEFQMSLGNRRILLKETTAKITC